MSGPIAGVLLPADDGLAGLLPMEARTAATLPHGPPWWYEPKWDGFRCLAFRRGDEVTLQSKSGKPLTRYFPDLVATLRALAAKEFVLDGEIVVFEEEGLSFDQLLQRIHPAESRVRRLARETPASLVVFDLLSDGPGADLTGLALERRRERLEKFAARHFGRTKRLASRLFLSPVATNLDEALRWVERSGAALDGLMAKRRDAPYRPGAGSGTGAPAGARGSRSGAGTDALLKFKFKRTADCVIGGYRLGSGSREVGSLLLGLHDDEGLLHHVGFTSTTHFKDRRELTRKLRALRKAPGFTGAAPGGPSRWATERSTEWEPLDPRLVVEVEFDHFTGGRFRHGTRFLRWRPDKSPRQCTLAQVRRDAGAALLLLGTPRSRAAAARTISGTARAARSITRAAAR